MGVGIANRDYRRLGGYTKYDDPSSHYSYDSNVANSRQMSVGDRLVFWERSESPAITNTLVHSVITNTRRPLLVRPAGLHGQEYGGIEYGELGLACPLAEWSCGLPSRPDSLHGDGALESAP